MPDYRETSLQIIFDVFITTCIMCPLVMSCYALLSTAGVRRAVVLQACQGPAGSTAV